MNKMAGELTILSWNVNGFQRKISEVLHHLNLLKADVVFLQETHMGPDQIYSSGSIKIQDLQYDYTAVFTVFKGSSRGVAILFKKNLGCGGFKVNGDPKGRFIIVSCQIMGDDYVFVNVYNSLDEKIIFTELDKFSTSTLSTAFLVVGGDFNTVMDANLDKTSKLRNRSHKSALRRLQSFLVTLSLVDVWRCLYPELKSFTYFGGKSQSRLDYFFVKSQSLNKVAACTIHRGPKYLDRDEYISDHAPLSIQIQNGGSKWQFDSGLLEDKTCATKLSNTLKKMSQIKIQKETFIWSGVKVRLLCEAMALQRSHLATLRSSIVAKSSQAMDHRGSESPIEFLPTSRTSPQTLSHFLNHLHQVERFDEIKSTLKNILDEPVSRQEILLAILSLPESGEPTDDGLTVHFYRHYLNQITDLLQAFFNQILDLESDKPVVELPNQELLDHTYCSDVQNRSSILSKNNVDHQIVSFILAGRLNGVIEHILSPGEIEVNTSLFQQCSPVLVVTLKLTSGAISKSYLLNLFKSLNLPNKFRSVLELLIGSDHSRSHDLRAGCPLTPLLKRICLLPLINSVNCENRVLGLGLQRGTIKSISDVVEAVVFLSNSEESLRVFELMLQDFFDATGCIVQQELSYS